LKPKKILMDMAGKTRYRTLLRFTVGLPVLVFVTICLLCGTAFMFFINDEEPWMLAEDIKKLWRLK